MQFFNISKMAALPRVQVAQVIENVDKAFLIQVAEAVFEEKKKEVCTNQSSWLK